LSSADQLGLPCKSPVTAGTSLLWESLDGPGMGGLDSPAMGTGGVNMAVGLPNLAECQGRDTLISAASTGLHTTLELGHLCRKAIFQDVK
jgi:hypothetical protein